MKRILATLGIFLTMVMAGILLAGAVSTEVSACLNPNTCSSSVCDTSGRTVFWLSDFRCTPCEDPTPYKVYECYLGCPDGGRCGCVATGCWAGFNPL